MEEIRIISIKSSEKSDDSRLPDIAQYDSESEEDPSGQQGDAAVSTDPLSMVPEDTESHDLDISSVQKVDMTRGSHKMHSDDEMLKDNLNTNTDELDVEVDALNTEIMADLTGKAEALKDEEAETLEADEAFAEAEDSRDLLEQERLQSKVQRLRGILADRASKGQVSKISRATVTKFKKNAAKRLQERLLRER